MKNFLLIACTLISVRLSALTHDLQGRKIKTIVEGSFDSDGL